MTESEPVMPPPVPVVNGQGDGQNSPFSREENRPPEAEPEVTGKPKRGRPFGAITKDSREQRYWFSVIQSSMPKLKPRDRIEVAIKILDRMVGGEWAKAEAAGRGRVDMSGDLYADLIKGTRNNGRAAPEEEPRPTT